VKKLAARHQGLAQIAIAAAGVETYELLRHVQRPNWPLALEHAREIVSWERFAHVEWEPALQSAVLRVPDLLRALDVFYFVGHFVLTGVFFLWLYRRSRPAFLALRLAGAAYLVYLGASSLLAAWRGHGPVPGMYQVRARYARPLRQGLFSNLSNPKMAVFFTSLLPQFGHSFAALLALGLVFSCMTLVWLTGYAIAVARAGDFLRRGWVRRALDALTGVVLVALGARLATDRR